MTSPVSESKEGYFQSTGYALEPDEDSVMISTGMYICNMYVYGCI